MRATTKRLFSFFQAALYVLRLQKANRVGGAPVAPLKNPLVRKLKKILTQEFPGGGTGRYDFYSRREQVADYLTASQTKDHFQDQLLRDHPEIVSIAPRLKLDKSGQPTKDGIIVIGVALRNPISLNVSAARASKAIPRTLPAVDARGSRIRARRLM